MSVAVDVTGAVRVKKSWTNPGSDHWEAEEITINGDEFQRIIEVREKEKK